MFLIIIKYTTTKILLKCLPILYINVICSALQGFVTQYASWRPLQKFVIVFSHEGNEGEVVKNLVLLASSFANKEYFSPHTEGDKYDEESDEEDSDKEAISESMEEEVPPPPTLQTEVSLNAFNGMHAFTCTSISSLLLWLLSKAYFLSDPSFL